MLGRPGRVFVGSGASTPAPPDNDISATASLAFSTVADLDATGSLSATGTLTFTTAADLDAGGDINATANLVFGTSATLNAPGTLSATGSLAFGSAADLSGAGSLAATASMTFSTAADLSGATSNDISAVASLSFGSSASVNATGTLGATGSLAFTTSADLSQAQPLAVTCTIVDIDGNALPGLTALSWAWFDAVDPNSFIAPTDQGEIETTDASAELVIELPNTTLTAGQSGTLILRTDDGVGLGAYNLEVA